MAPSLPYISLFDPKRLRSYLLRLPLFTRIIFVLIVVFWLLEFQSVWNIVQWGSLIPKEINLGTSMFRDYEKPLQVLVDQHNLEASANPLAYRSVPTKHLSSYPHKLPQRCLQQLSACSPLGTIRS